MRRCRPPSLERSPSLPTIPSVPVRSTLPPPSPFLLPSCPSLRRPAVAPIRVLVAPLLALPAPPSQIVSEPQSVLGACRKHVEVRPAGTRGGMAAGDRQERERLEEKKDGRGRKEGRYSAGPLPLSLSPPVGFAFRELDLLEQT
eukprot:3123370-Rhodomonas_salina.1